MHFTIPIFERRDGHQIDAITLGLGPFTKQRSGHNPHKVRTGIIDALRAVLVKAKGHERRRFEMPRGIEHQRVRLELTLTGGDRRKVSGVYPIVLEPRWASADERMFFAYHPFRQDDAVTVRRDLPLDEQLRPHLGRAWADLDDGELASLPCRTRERIDVVSFSCDTHTLLDDLRSERDLDEEEQAARRKRRGLRVLPSLGVNLSERAARDDFAAGVPRPPYRERLQLLLGTGNTRSVIVVGPSGSGKTTLINRAVADLLEADGYPAHRNLDRVRPVFRVSGRRIIAGMSRMGDWEQRCVEVLEDVRARSVILAIDDLAHFGRIGRSRESERSLADFFRGPVARRELVVIGEMTEEETRRLEQDAPSFAACFARLHLAPTSSGETLRLLLREVRELERRHKVEVSPFALRSILELGGSLLSARAFPGEALDLLRELARACEGAREPSQVGTREVLALLSRKTGVPELLLRGEAKLDVAAVEEALGKQVMGQQEAVKVAADLICRVKAGLVDPRRPYGVLLFTGPTGTGKTELAKCLSELLYGSPTRMLRFDMSELADHDAPSRLIGDRYRPEGLLTQRVIEQPFSLVLLDEIEKAHPSVLSLLLQLFEDGRLTDAAGRTAHFQHAVVVMTSNLGARHRPAVGFTESEGAILADVARAVREFFPPELQNRIDRVVPFRPLTPEVAAMVAGKELELLSRRRGLSERSIFVNVAPGVAAHVAREAFVARDGARSIKRFLEDRIGSELAGAITSGAPASMQLLVLDVRDDRFTVTREALVEAAPAPTRFALEPLLGLPLARLQGELAPLISFVDTLESSGDLARLSERIRYHLARQGEREHALAVYNLDAMRAAVQAFRARMEALAQPDDALEHEQLEMDRFGFVTVPICDCREHRVRLFSRAQMPPRLRQPRRGEVLDCLAEGFWLRRALRLVDDPQQHAVFADVARAADLSDHARFAPAEPGPVFELSRIYAHARGELEGWAACGADGVRVAEPGDLRGEISAASRIVVKLVGLCVRDFLELETGAHVWSSTARGPEVVRVRVTAAEAGEAPLDVLSRAVSGPLPEVVRKLRFERPKPGGPPLPFEIEDYVMGYAETVRAQSLADALGPLFLLRSSREDP